VGSGPVDLVFDTRGGEVPAGERVVTIAEKMPGAIYFIVEPDHEQLLELRTLADAGVLRAEVDSVFPLTEARAAFEPVAGLGKCGEVVLEVGTDQLTGAAVTSAVDASNSEHPPGRRSGTGPSIEPVPELLGALHSRPRPGRAAPGQWTMYRSTRSTPSRSRLRSSSATGSSRPGLNLVVMKI
jgi:hypothetical protein